MEAANTALRVEKLGLEDVHRVIELAADEGWNPGRFDAETFHAADPHAFFGAFVEGELAACISITRYGTKLGFLGFYICAPRYRGRGIGYGLWRNALGRFGELTIALDGVLAQQDNYRKSGFESLHANHRYGGEPRKLASSYEAVELKAVTHDELAQYDAAVFGTPRPHFLKVWMAQPGAEARCVVREGRLCGFALARPCLEGTKIGPLFADDAGAARSLFVSLSGSIPSPVFLDVPQPNAAAVALVSEAGLKPVFETARMMRGAGPHSDLNRTFGFSSVEFG